MRRACSFTSSPLDASSSVYAEHMKGLRPDSRLELRERDRALPKRAPHLWVLHVGERDADCVKDVLLRVREQRRVFDTCGDRRVLLHQRAVVTDNRLPARPRCRRFGKALLRPMAPEPPVHDKNDEYRKQIFHVIPRFQTLYTASLFCRKNPKSLAAYVPAAFPGGVLRAASSLSRHHTAASPRMITRADP